MQGEKSAANRCSQVTLDIVRETGDKTNWLNRFVQDAQTKVPHP
jgi:hypothetical protein